MRVLLTRNKSDSEVCARRLSEAGHSAVIAPLTEIVTRPLPNLARPPPQALIVTSRNALQALAADPSIDDLVELPIFTVGPATTALAHGLGFHGVMEGPGTAAGLVDEIVANADPRGGRLIHLAGTHLSFDLAGALAAHGYQTDVVTVYSAEPVAKLDGMARDALATGGIDAVALMSPRTAREYVRHMRDGGLVGSASDIYHLCLSQAVAEPLSALGDVPIAVADRPNSEEMLALVNRIAAQLGQ